MVIFDTSMLLLLLDKKTPAPASITFPRERLGHLVQTLQEKNAKIIIPTPVLSEVLILAGPAGAGYFPTLERSNAFRIAPFDTRAAVELAIMTADALKHGKKRGPSVQSWAKVKFDRQIVSIGKTLGVTAIYSDDEDLRALAKAQSITPYGLADLPIPPQTAQTTFLDTI